jgi:predicted kinase
MKVIVMSETAATLHMLCGKTASGKSTLATNLAERHGAVIVCGDFWLSRLYPGEINTLADLSRCAGRWREAMGPHLVALLRGGMSVVLDFHANTLASRAWMRDVYEQAGANHQLHFLDVPDDVCRERLRRRNAAGTHEYVVSDDEFDLITSHFVAPSQGEGFNTILYRVE